MRGGRPSRFGLQIFGSQGVVQMFDTGHLPDMGYLPESSWVSGRQQDRMDPDQLGRCRPARAAGEPQTAKAATCWRCSDLIAAIEEDRQPLCQHLRGPNGHGDDRRRVRVAASGRPGDLPPGEPAEPAHAAVTFQVKRLRLPDPGQICPTAAGLVATALAIGAASGDFADRRRFSSQGFLGALGGNAVKDFVSRGSGGKTIAHAVRHGNPNDHKGTSPGRGERSLAGPSCLPAASVAPTGAGRGDCLRRPTPHAVGYSLVAAAAASPSNRRGKVSRRSR